MINKIAQQLLSDNLSDEAIYEIYNFSLTLTQLIKHNYSEVLERYCFEQHHQKIEKESLSTIEDMLFDDNKPPF